VTYYCDTNYDNGGRSRPIKLFGAARTRYDGMRKARRGERPQAASELIWLHVLAIGFSTLYLKENAEGVKSDWPRVPLPTTKDALEYSAKLGRWLLALLDAKNDVPGVTAGKVSECYKVIGGISAMDLRITCGWGHADKTGRIFPGQGLGG